jgi:SAM-dependent methyltransferase
MTTPDEGSSRRIADHWGDDRRGDFYAGGGLYWTQLPAVQRRINEKVSGDPARDWVDHLVATHLPGRCPVARTASLGCGYGHQDREVVARGVTRRVVGYDISEGALARARRLADEAGLQGIEYIAADVNALRLEEGAFDLVLASGALHHLTDLEAVAETIAGGLREGGLLVADEYVGPNRFAYSDRQMALINEALALLPERYRRSVSFARTGRVGPGAERGPMAWALLAWMKLRSGTLLAALRRRLGMARLRKKGEALVRTEVRRIAASELALDDPSEAVRSADILPVLGEYLDLVEVRPYGGSILMPLLDDIAGNFEGDDPEAGELLRRLFAFEDEAIASGEIGSDYAFIVACRRT